MTDLHYGRGYGKRHAEWLAQQLRRRNIKPTEDCQHKCCTAEEHRECPSKVCQALRTLRLARRDETDEPDDNG